MLDQCRPRVLSYYPNFVIIPPVSGQAQGACQLAFQGSILPLLFNCDDS